MNCALFFGAGASAWAGYRTFLTFPGLFWPSGKDPSELEVTDKERRLLSEMKIHLNKRHLPLTLDMYLALIDEYISVTNLGVSHTIMRERLLSTALEWASLQELRELLITIRERICRLTAEHYRKGILRESTEKIGTVKDFFASISQEMQNKTIELFTTNYDILPEYLFSSNNYFKKDRHPSEDEPNFTFENGFNGFEDAELNQVRSVFSYKRNKENQSQGGDLRIICTRLHGCVAWLHGEIGDENIYFNITSIDDIHNFANKLCVSYPGHEQLLGRTPHKEGYERFAEVCLTVDCLIFVGFSFRDQEIALCLEDHFGSEDKIGWECPRSL